MNYYILIIGDERTEKILPENNNFARLYRGIVISNTYYWYSNLFGDIKIYLTELCNNYEKNVSFINTETNQMTVDI